MERASRIFVSLALILGLALGPMAFAETNGNQGGTNSTRAALETLANTLALATAFVSPPITRLSTFAVLLLAQSDQVSRLGSIPNYVRHLQQQRKETGKGYLTLIREALSQQNELRTNVVQRANAAAEELAHELKELDHVIEELPPLVRKYYADGGSGKERFERAYEQWKDPQSMALTPLDHWIEARRHEPKFHKLAGKWLPRYERAKRDALSDASRFQIAMEQVNRDRIEKLNGDDGHHYTASRNEPARFHDQTGRPWLYHQIPSQVEGACPRAYGSLAESSRILTLGAVAAGTGGTLVQLAWQQFHSDKDPRVAAAEANNKIDVVSVSDIALDQLRAQKPLLKKMVQDYNDTSKHHIDPKDLDALLAPGSSLKPAIEDYVKKVAAEKFAEGNPDYPEANPYFQYLIGRWDPSKKTDQAYLHLAELEKRGFLRTLYRHLLTDRVLGVDPKETGNDLYYLNNVLDTLVEKTMPKMGSVELPYPPKVNRQSGSASAAAGTTAPGAAGDTGTPPALKEILDHSPKAVPPPAPAVPSKPPSASNDAPSSAPKLAVSPGVEDRHQSSVGLSN